MPKLTEKQRIGLGKRTSSRTLAARDVSRLRVILASVDEQTCTKIMSRSGTSAPVISQWKQRFEEDGLSRLGARHIGSRLRLANATLQARITRRTRQVSPDWLDSLVLPLDRPGLGGKHKHGAAGPVGAAPPRLQPHRLDRYMASEDAAFEQRAADIIGLHIRPLEHADVLRGM
jgi:hypothetical protein